jgi:hypothetical protein
LYFFNARWLDPVLGRFAQADTLVPEPGNPQAWDRYAFGYNNPLRYTDPSGHMICDGDGRCGAAAGTGSQIWLKGFTRYELEKYSLRQESHTSGCAPYSMAMAINLNTRKHYLTGDDVEMVLESRLKKIPGVGIPPYFQDNALDAVAPAYSNEYQSGGTKEDLIENLREGTPTIVSVSWGSNMNMLTTGQVGHSMVLVGYEMDRDEFMFMDPGRYKEDPIIRTYSSDEFMKIWQKQPNIFIPSGSMVSVRKDY